VIPIDPLGLLLIREFKFGINFVVHSTFVKLVEEILKELSEL